MAGIFHGVVHHVYCNVMSLKLTQSTKENAEATRPSNIGQCLLPLPLPKVPGKLNDVNLVPEDLSSDEIITTMAGRGVDGRRGSPLEKHFVTAIGDVKIVVVADVDTTSIIVATRTFLLDE